MNTDNHVMCTRGKKWIHNRCSDVHGDLSLVVDGLGVSDVMAQSQKLILLGSSRGGAHLTAIPRIRNRLMKFRVILPFLISRAPPLV